MSLHDEESSLVAALRADVPSAEEQERMRRRLLAAGLAVGSELFASSAAAGQASSGAAASAKVAAVSWTVKLGVVATVAASAVVVPLWLSSLKSGAARTTASVGLSVPQSAPVRQTQPQLSAGSEHGAFVASPSAGGAPVLLPVARVTANAATPRAASETPASSAPLLLDTRAPDNGAKSPAVAAFAPENKPGTESAGPPQSEAERARASTLAEETRLLDRAFTELSAGNQSAAAALIAEHERRFPDGLLRQERERARDRLKETFRGP